MPEGDVPMFVLEEAFEKGTTDHKDGLVVDAQEPKLKSDHDSPKPSAVDSSWSMLEEEVDQEEVYPEENLEEEPEEEPEVNFEEEDLEEDPEYDPDEN